VPVDKTGSYSHNKLKLSRQTIAKDLQQYRIIMNPKEKDCTKLIMQDADAGKSLHNLKRKRARGRGNITSSVTELGKFTDTMTLEDYEYYQDRLRETLSRLTSLDDEIHELMDDSEYDANLQKYE
jgi:hypothetical protein